MTKRIISVLLALVLVLALSTSALAGTITVTDPVEGQTYTAYKLFDITVLPGATSEDDSISYKVADEWKEFFAEGGIGRTYVDVDTAGNVTKKEGADFAEFAKAAIAYAKANNKTGITAEVKDGKTVITAGEGYYAIDTTVGVLCMLSNATGSVEIDEKNEPNTIEKKIVDSTEEEGKTLVDQNDVNVGDTVYYQATISAKKGTEKMKMVDKMQNSLTFDPSSVKVQIKDGAYLTANTDYEVKTTGLAEGVTFEVEFKNTVLPLTADTTYYVTYSAVLNENAVIDGANKNDVKLIYGENYDIETEWDTVETTTFDFDVFKYTGTEKTALAGAEFELKTENGTVALKFTKTVAEDGTNVYLLDDEGEATLVSGTNGKIEINGLDEGTYKLKETKAPAGYNLLEGEMTISISDSGEVTYGGKTVTQVEVENNKGTKLPETGGIGTTIFYLVGGLMMAAAVVLLVAKKRTVNE